MYIVKKNMEALAIKYQQNWSTEETRRLKKTNQKLIDIFYNWKDDR